MQVMIQMVTPKSGVARAKVSVRAIVDVLGRRELWFQVEYLGHEWPDDNYKFEGYNGLASSILLCPHVRMTAEMEGHMYVRNELDECRRLRKLFAFVHSPGDNLKVVTLSHESWSAFNVYKLCVLEPHLFGAYVNKEIAPVYPYKIWAYMDGSITSPKGFCRRSLSQHELLKKFQTPINPKEWPDREMSPEF